MTTKRKTKKPTKSDVAVVPDAPADPLASLSTPQLLACRLAEMLTIANDTRFDGDDGELERRLIDLSLRDGIYPGRLDHMDVNSLTHELACVLLGSQYLPNEPSKQAAVVAVKKIAAALVSSILELQQQDLKAVSPAIAEHLNAVKRRLEQRAHAQQAQDRAKMAAARKPAGKKRGKAAKSKTAKPKADKPAKGKPAAWKQRARAAMGGAKAKPAKAPKAAKTSARDAAALDDSQLDLVGGE